MVNPLDEPPEISFRQSRPFHPCNPRTDRMWRRHLEELKRSFVEHSTRLRIGCIAIDSLDEAAGDPQTELNFLRKLPSSIERRLGQDRANADMLSGLYRPQRVQVGIWRDTREIVSRKVLREATSRHFYVFGDIEAKKTFDQLAIDASRCIVRLPRQVSMVVWKDWLDLDRWDEEDQLWLDALFELAWNEHSPLLRADRFYWSGNNTLLVGDSIAHKSAFGNSSDSIPENASFSKIDDLFRASGYAIDVLLNIGDDRLIHAPAKGNDSTTKRFAVALSFPGEHRTLVSEIAGLLAAELNTNRVFYDFFHQAELARPDLDTYIQHIYHDDSELIVVFLCREYETKEWCGLEWRAVRDLIKKKQGDSIMLVRLDDTDIPGSFSIDGYVDARGRLPTDVASLILDRIHRSSPR